MDLSAPEPLGGEHLVNEFDSGYDSLDRWLRQSARANQRSRASRTYVVCSDGRVVAYYALASGAVERHTTPGPIARRMPDPIPVIVLGRLAVDRHWQGRGLGPALLKHAMMRTLHVSTQVGVRALLVHAIDDAACRFYRHYGFKPSRFDDYTLMLSIADIARAGQ